MQTQIDKQLNNWVVAVNDFNVQFLTLKCSLFIKLLFLFKINIINGILWKVRVSLETRISGQEIVKNL